MSNSVPSNPFAQLLGGANLPETPQQMRDLLDGFAPMLNAGAPEVGGFHSKVPVAYTHCCPEALKAHPRNKSDEQLQEIAAHDGFVGVAAYPPFLAAGPGATLEDYLDAVEHVIRLAGEERVGIGTDFTQDQGDDFFHWLRSDKGYGRKLVDLGVPSRTPMTVEGLRTIGDLPNLTAALEKRGWPEKQIRRFLGENWLAFLGEVWGA